MELSEKTDIESLRDTILCGDALEILCSLPSESLQMCVTSPPYYGLRDYGVSGQIGSELSPHEYISRLTVVFREVRRILKKDGTLWLNIGDSYAGSGKGAWDKPIAERKKNKQIYHFYTTDSTSAIPKVWDGIKQKDMIGIPWMLAFALRSDGWYLRSDIIWEKPNCLPEPVKDRPTKSYEHLFLFAKSCRYYYDQMAIMEEVADSTVRRYKSGVSDTNKYASFSKTQKLFRGRTHSEMSLMRNKRDVWRISTNQQKIEGHFAVFPEKLVEPCILAGSGEGSIILDPFIGSGTTGVVAKRLNRHFIGIDLNPQYCEMARSRITETEE